MHIRRWQLALLCVGAVPVAMAQVPAFQSVETIRGAAVAALGAQSQAEVVVDAQQRVPQCRQPLQARITNPRTVVVRCDDAPGWQLYVPVRGRVDVATAPTVTTAGRAAEPRAVAGAATGRRLPAAADAQAPGAPESDALRRGDPVVLVSRAGGIEVRMGGRALGPAQTGGIVTVENSSTHRILRGRLVASGEVEVML